MKLLKRLFISLLLLLVCSYFSCKKEKADAVNINATILNFGSIATDGCGWVININGTIYSANLSSDYEVDSLKVIISYRNLTNRFYCGQLPVPQNTGMPVIHIISIARQ